MRPIYLEMHAFGPYAGKQAVDFTQLGTRNVFLIYGPTGAGKTTVLDAICYALYGDTSGSRRSGAHMRSEYASPQEPTSVCFVFAIGSACYRVERQPEQEIAKKRGHGLKHAAAAAVLYACKPNGETTQVLAAKNVTAAVENLLGFKSEQFRQVVLLPQGDFRKLLLASSSERQQIMQTLFHTQRYAMLQELAKKQYDAIAKSYSLLADRTQQTLQQLEVASAADLQTKLADMQHIKEEQEQALQQARADRDAYQKTVQAAQMLYGHWQTVKAKRQEAARLAEQKDIYDAKRVHVEQLRRVQVLAEPMQQLDEILAQGKAKGSEADDMAALVQQAAARYARVQKQDKELQEKQTLMQAEKEECLHLQGLTDKVKAYAALCAEEHNVARLVQQAEADWQRVRNEADAVRKQLEEGRRVLRRQAEWIAEWEKAKGKVKEVYDRWQQEVRIEEVNKTLAVQQQRWKDAKAQEKAAAEAANNSRLNYEAVQSLFLQGQAAVLAADLQDGMPCPVCGATHHPQPAAAMEQMPRKEDVERRKQAADASEQIRQHAALAARQRETEYKAGQSQYQSLRQQYPFEGDSAAWQRQYAVWDERQQALAKQVEEAAALQQKTAAWEERQVQLQADEETMRHSVETVRLQAARIAEGKEKAETDIPKIYRNEKKLLERIAVLANHVQSYEKAVGESSKAILEATKELTKYQEQHASLQKQVQALRDQYVQAAAVLRQRVAAAGLESVAVCRQLQHEVVLMQEEEEDVASYDKKVQQVQGQIAQEETAISGQPEPVMAHYTAVLQEKNDTCRRLAEEGARHCTQMEQLTAIQKQLADWQQKQDMLTKQYKTVGAVYELIAGKQTGVNFERYVLGALLDEVLAAANVRLGGMSRHRYELQRSKTWDDKRVKQIGLDIEVFDNFTGYARPANTLSGGETFLASLSLALGLADVVQTYSGGIHLDTIFIDEGFGTLDGETLDFALKALLNLRVGGRLVGIISHVPELKERIDARLAVHKTDRGSMASFELL